MNEGCPICLSPLKPLPLSPKHSYNINCPRCGNFNISETAYNMLNNSLNYRQIANASGWIRENQGIEILSNDIDNLKNLRTLSIAEKADKLLLYLSKSFPVAGQTLQFGDKQLHLVAMAISRSQDSSELSYLVKNYLSQEKGFLIYESGNNEFKISPKGWAYIDSINQINPESLIAFVAMWFDEKLKPLWTKAIKPGIEAAGYEPVRIDMRQHNNRIDDEIVAMIRRSRFIVADFTGQRGGVYFEAGFALGLGLPVIWICSKDELKQVHFDTRQYNFITWEDGELDDLGKALQYRIEATIGHGNYKP